MKLSKLNEQISTLTRQFAECGEDPDVLLRDNALVDTLSNRLLDDSQSETFNVYIFADHETATLWSTPVLSNVSGDTTKLSDDQIRQILLNAMDDDSLAEYPPEVINTWSVEKCALAMWEIVGVILNSAALVPTSSAAFLSKLGNALAGQFGDDSSTYRACKTFGDVLRHEAVRVIDFPPPNTDSSLDEMV